MKFALVAGGDLRRLQNQRVIVVFPCSVDCEIERTGPDIFGIHNDEFVVHDRRTVVGYDGNARFFELLHGGKHDVVLIGDDPDFHSAFCRFGQSVRDFVKIQIINADVDCTFCRIDEIAKSFPDIRRRGEIEFDGIGIGNGDDRGILITGTVRQKSGDRRIAGTERERMHRFERFGDPFLRKIGEARAERTEKQGNTGNPAAHHPVRRFPGRLDFCLPDSFFCVFSVAHTILENLSGNISAGRRKVKADFRNIVRMCRENASSPLPE